MKSENNTPFRGFMKAYNQLPAGIQKDVKKKIQIECEWYAPATFYAKARGATSIKNPEWKVLEMIFTENGIDVYTGKVLQIA